MHDLATCIIPALQGRCYEASEQGSLLLLSQEKNEIHTYIQLVGGTVGGVIELPKFIN